MDNENACEQIWNVYRNRFDSVCARHISKDRIHKTFVR